MYHSTDDFPRIVNKIYFICKHYLHNCLTVCVHYVLMRPPWHS